MCLSFHLQSETSWVRVQGLGMIFLGMPALFVLDVCN